MAGCGVVCVVPCFALPLVLFAVFPILVPFVPLVSFCSSCVTPASFLSCGVMFVVGEEVWWGVLSSQCMWWCGGFVVCVVLL